MTDFPFSNLGPMMTENFHRIKNESDIHSQNIYKALVFVLIMIIVIQIG